MPSLTNTFSPVADTGWSVALVQVKGDAENGCPSGRGDADGSEQATYTGLRDQLNLLSERVDSSGSPAP